jgi:2-oxoglutarate ferredoxin oxidoreductase subunit alpha
MNIRGISWLIGGAQGTGIERGASIFLTAIASAGYYVFGKREYHSNIMGEHSYYYIRFDSKPVHSHIERYNILASYDAETIFRHSLEGLTGSAIIYNSAHINVKTKDIPTLDKRVREDIHKRFNNDLVSISDVLKEAQSYGIKSFPINYNEILNKVSLRTGEKLSELTRMNNVIAVSASLAILKFDLDLLKKAINRVFKGRKTVVELNSIVAEETYNFVNSLGYPNEFNIRVNPINNNNKRLLINGNQAIALGKLLGGCRFQTYYPITPATDESSFLEEHEIFDVEYYDPLRSEREILKGAGSIVVVETEDEIAAITMASGAALAGARASTSTSGPGFSLMVEGLGFAGMNEIPVVITHYQRGAPSTGMPTRTEQGDLRFVLHASHGEFPRIVLASGDITECFYDAIRCFNYAERYQLPVIHLVDRFLAQSTASIEPFDTKSVRIDRGIIFEEKDLEKLKAAGEKYKRFAFNPTGISPRVFLGTKNAVFWITGDEHDELGHITEDPVIRDKMMEKRMKKLEIADKEIPLEEKVNHFYASENPDLTIVSWGSTKGVILDLIEELSKEGYKIEFLQIRLMQPFPSSYVEKVLNGKKWICVENNYSGQLAGLIREKTGLKPNNLIVKYNGRQISLDEIYIAVRSILEGKSSYRVVLRGGA